MGRPQTIFVGDKFLIKGQPAVVMEYISHKRIRIQFEDGYETWSRSFRILSGDVQNPLRRTVHGVGYVGVGNHRAGAQTRVYNVWHNMIQRCYSPQAKVTNPTYVDCKVTDEWHNFQNFADWYKHVFTEGKEFWELDKDIISRGNRVYGPDYCVPLPSEVNTLLLSSPRRRGKCCVGVGWHTRDKVYQANCNVDNKAVFLGYYDTEEAAFLAYKNFKEAHIKVVANKWRDKIDPRAYAALMNYTVEITD